MAFGTPAAIITAFNSKTGTTLSSTTLIAAAVGDLVVVYVASDNAGTTDATGADNIVSVADNVGNTYTLAHGYRNGQGAAQAGVHGSVWYTNVTNAMAVGTSITVTNATTAYARSVAVAKVTMAAGFFAEVVGTAAGAGDTGVDPTATISGLTNEGHLWIACGVDETTTPAAAYTGFTRLSVTGSSTSGGSAQSNVALSPQYAVDTASTTKTFTPSMAVDSVAVLVAFKETSLSTADAWSVIDKSAGITLSNVDKTATGSGGVRSTTSRVNGTAGKYYSEFVVGAATGASTGWGLQDLTTSVTSFSGKIWVSRGGLVRVSGTFLVDIGVMAPGDVVGLAWDAGAERFWFRRNSDNWNADASADPATGTNGFDASSIANVSLALWLATNATGDSITLRTELAEYTQIVPYGFTSWMGETPPTVNVTATVTGVSITASIGAVTIPVPATADAWNANDKSAVITLSNNDKTSITTGSFVLAGVRTTTTRMNGTAGKWYAEFLIGSATPANIGITPVSNSLTSQANNFYAINSFGVVRINGSDIGSLGGTLAAGDIISIAWDSGAERAWFRRNANNWNNTAGHDPATNVGGFDCSFAAAEAHALWVNHYAINSGGTIRTELAEYTQAVPSGFTSWMDEASGPVNVTVNVTGLGITSAINGVTAYAPTNVDVPVTGIDITAAINSVDVTGKSNVTATSQSLATAISGVTVSAVQNVSVTVASLSLTAAITGVTAKGSSSVTVTGLSATTAISGVTATGAINVSTTVGSQSLSTAINGVTASGAQNVTTVVGSVPITVAIEPVTVSIGAVNVTATVTGLPLTATISGVTAAGQTNVSTTVGSLGITSAISATTAVGQRNVSTTVVSIPIAASISPTTASGTSNVSTTAAGFSLAAAINGATVSTTQNVAVTVASNLLTSGVTGVSVTAGGSISVSAGSIPITASYGGVTVTAQQYVSTTVGSVPISAAISGVTATGIRHVSTTATSKTVFVSWNGVSVTAIQNVTATVAGLPLTTAISGVTASGIANATATVTGLSLTAALTGTTVTAKQNVTATVTGLPLSAAISSVNVPSVNTTLNPIDKKSGLVVLSNGNLTATGTDTGGNNWVRSTTAKAGKRYVEFTINTVANTVIGLSDLSAMTFPGSDAHSFGLFYHGFGSIAGTFPDWGGGQAPVYNTYTTGNIVSMAVDITAKKIWWRVNGGNWNGNAANNPATNTGGIDISLYTGSPHHIVVSGDNLCVTTVNFGTTAFTYALPSGFLSWDGVFADATAILTGQSLALTANPVITSAIRNVSTTVGSLSLTAALNGITIKGNATATITASSALTTAINGVAVTTIRNAAAPVTGLSIDAALSPVTLFISTVSGMSLTLAFSPVTVVATGKSTVGWWDGREFAVKPAKIWTGTAWVRKPIKHWNGSTWV